MMRPAQSFLKHAVKIARPSVVSVAPRASQSYPALVISCRSSSTAASSCSSDYEQIMRTSASNFSSVANDIDWFPPTSSSTSSTAHSTSYSPASPGAGVATTSQVPSGMGAAQNITRSNCYRSLDEPTSCEDYDQYELHHPPCSKTQASYYDTSYDPNSTASGVMGL
eukprot:CAMPEP_0183725946 /NCGR_PEP_ID=MMETSP0737-20130205/21939_1 /TAXON_ID=385413 /ORGANISM="Thalassiosira miniscula, Strain CCMP1093" /LENGTH=166 /DNA_ID=CAMNT_0025957125 /DNA_START=188 /DNA_END=688 /DNA_ORIENTATION=+